MKRLRPFFYFLAACALASCATHPIDTPGQRTTLTFRHVSVGLCEDYPKESRSLASARNDLALLKTNRIHVLRISFSWLDMEPSPGKYDWSFWDDFVRMATDEYGVRLIPYVCYTPRWASTSPNEDYWQQPPADNKQFAEFAKQLVTRYKDRIHSWEIWNEPDNPYYWRGSVEQFADLLRAGASAVREADRSATVVMGGLAWNPEFLESVLASPAISNVDVINLHNYYETWASEPLERIPDYVGHAADLIHLHGQHQPIWLAEVGYSDFRRGAFVSGQYAAHFGDEHTPEAQAAALFRALTLAFSSGNVSLIAWYRIHDLPASQGVIGDDNNRHLGILDVHDGAKPALHALQFFDSIFTNDFRCIDNEVRIGKIIGAPVEVHAFEQPDGRIVVAAWLRTYVPGERKTNQVVVDRRAASISLTLPFATAGSAALFDELGKKHGEMAMQHGRQSSRISQLTLKDGTVTILELNRAPRSAAR